MYSAMRKKAVQLTPLSGRSVASLAFSLSFPVIGLDQFLRTLPAQLAVHPASEAGRWLTDSMMALPLFAVGVLAADWIARRVVPAGDRRGAIAGRAALITVACALVLAPAWFQVDRTDDPVTAQPLVFPHASDSGDVYWVAPGVIIALACVPLAAGAAWAGYRVLRRATAARRAAPHWLPDRVAAVVRATLIAAAVTGGAAAVPALAWLLHQAAYHAYASRVYQSGPQPAPQPHQVQPGAPPSGTAPSRVAASATRASQPAPSAPGAFAYQVAHALQDGLAGQAAGLPVILVALARGGGAIQASRNRREASPFSRQPPRTQRRVHE